MCPMSADWTTHQKKWIDEEEKKLEREKGRQRARTLKKYWQVNFNSMDALSYLPYTGYDRLLYECLCTVLKFRRARNNMVQQSDRREDGKKKSIDLKCVYPFIPSEWTWNPYDISISVRDPKALTLILTTQSHLYGCAFFLSLCSRCITQVVVIVSYLRVYRCLAREKKKLYIVQCHCLFDHNFP